MKDVCTHIPRYVHRVPRRSSIESTYHNSKENVRRWTNRMLLNVKQSMGRQSKPNSSDNAFYHTRTPASNHRPYRFRNVKLQALSTIQRCCFRTSTHLWHHVKAIPEMGETWLEVLMEGLFDCYCWTPYHFRSVIFRSRARKLTIWPVTSPQFNRVGRGRADWVGCWPYLCGRQSLSQPGNRSPTSRQIPWQLLADHPIGPPPLSAIYFSYVFCRSKSLCCRPGKHDV